MSIWNRISSEGASGGEGVNQGATRILSATINGQPTDTDLIVPERGQLWLTSGTWTRGTGPANITLEIEYGNRHLHNNVDFIALLEVEDRLPASRLSRAADAANDEFGSYTFGDPMMHGRKSRVGDVNRWVQDQNHGIPIA
jgi:hypothetical protein